MFAAACLLEQWKLLKTCSFGNNAEKALQSVYCISERYRPTKEQWVMRWQGAPNLLDLEQKLQDVLPEYKVNQKISTFC